MSTGSLKTVPCTLTYTTGKVYIGSQESFSILALVQGGASNNTVNLKKRCLVPGCYQLLFLKYGRGKKITSHHSNS